MKKLFATLNAGALALSLSGIAFAADDTKSNDPAQREQEYIAALKKCDPLTGADKQKCIEAAKKKFGQM
jgi:hypothetical protein